MYKFDITILTDKRYYQPLKIDDYTNNVLTEDKLLKEALEKKGLKVTRTYWDNPNFDWNSTRYAIFRTTWDYFDRFDEFEPWLAEAGKKTEFINTPEILYWNIDKHYLGELENKGINIPKTIFIEKGDTRSFEDIVKTSSWNELILKPCISGAARHTYRFKAENAKDYQDIFKNLISTEAMMLQEFQNNILEKGEVGFMIFGGKYSHAVLKIAKSGDFRVQDDFGGTVHEYNPSIEEIKWAESVVSKVDTMPAYARVDMIWDNDNNPAVSELEMIEPELWFRRNGNAANMLSAYIFEYYFDAKIY